MSSVPPPLAESYPLPSPPEQAGKTPATRQVLAVLLSVCLGLFLADAVISLLDDSLNLWFGIHLLNGPRGIVCLLAMLMALVIYVLMGLTPMIPKRLFLPLALFNPLATLAVIPFAIFVYSHLLQVGTVISLGQVIFGLAILFLLQGGFKLHWPLVTEKQLEAPRFSWRNTCVFLAANLFVLAPAIIIYLVLCATVAVNHFSDGFLALRPGGLTVQVRKYARSDGKTVQLFPMSHIGEADFYGKVSQSFPSNSIILMEGVTDDRNLLTNKITYQRMASSLGLAEQHEEFNPTQGELVPADVDVEQFTKNTIGFLNLVMLVHAKGVNAETVMQVMRYTPPAHFEEQLFDDLLRKRNQHLLEELHARLPQTEHIIIPWGVAHMPEIGTAIQKAGFRLTETEEYVAIRFGPTARKTKHTGKEKEQAKPD